jgi:hypothetical protein
MDKTPGPSGSPGQDIASLDTHYWCWGNHWLVLAGKNFHQATCPPDLALHFINADLHQLHFNHKSHTASGHFFIPMMS